MRSELLGYGPVRGVSEEATGQDVADAVHALPHMGVRASRAASLRQRFLFRRFGSKAPV